ncbi:MAG TPA: hypothetical protein VFI23_14265 [Rhizomicrobium sp.]|nr:hypothetical protein [Rhizomicrobium sp.]
MIRDLSRLTPPELLVLHAGITDELRRRRITRSSNNPVGDLAEHLCCRAFDWTLAPNSMRDADATDASKTRYQIKSRRLTTHNASRQLGAIRDLQAKGFDFLAGVLFDNDFRIQRGALIPHSVVAELARRVDRTNSWRFILRDAVWSKQGVRDITRQLQDAERQWADNVSSMDPNSLEKT